MSEKVVLHKLSPAGYLILQDSEQARLTNEHRRAFGPYFGVDRLPPFLPPDGAIRQALGQPPVQDQHLYAVLEEWFAARLWNDCFHSGSRPSGATVESLSGLWVRI